MTPLHKLYTKLCRELVQSEHSAIIHSRREVKRLGAGRPATALLALGAHAASLRPRLATLMATRQPMGALLGRAVGQIFSTLRHYVFDRLLDVERSYRGTLLGFHHGIATVRLLREVSERLGDLHLAGFCDDLLADRMPLVEAAEYEVTWFAHTPARAIRAGLRVALEP